MLYNRPNQIKNKIKKLNNFPQLRDAVIILDSAGSLVHDEDIIPLMRSWEGTPQPQSLPEGIGVLTNYIVRTQTTNIRNSVVPKIPALIKDAVNLHLNKKELSRNDKAIQRSELMRLINTPTKSRRRGTVVELDENDRALVQFFREGLFPFPTFTQQHRNEKWLDDEYFDRVKKDAVIPNLITFFVRCLHRQETQETETFKGRKRKPVPTYKRGRRVTISIEAQSFYYLIKNAKVLQKMRSQDPLLSPEEKKDTVVGEPKFLACNHFKADRPTIIKWIHYLFDFSSFKADRSGEGKWKLSDDKGIVFTTDGVAINILKRLRYSDIEDSDSTDDELRTSIFNVGLSPYQSSDDSDFSIHSRIDDDDEGSNDDNSLQIGEVDMSIDEMSLDTPVINDDSGHSMDRTLSTGESSLSSTVHFMELDALEEEGQTLAPCIANVDPGRRNIIYCVILDPSGNFIKKVVLTRAQYYEESGINANRKLNSKWNRSLQEMDEEFSENHFITTNRNSQIAAFRTYKTFHLQMWQNRGYKKRGSRQKLHLYQQKSRVIDNMFNQFDNFYIDGVQYKLSEVRYEDGNFSSGGRGERSVP